jgi:hypothetical protein
MKRLSPQSIIIAIAFIFAIAITLFVGGFNENSSTFYLNTFVVNINFIGDSFFAFGLVIFAYFFYNKKRRVLKLLCAFIITIITSQIIKNIFSDLPFQIYFDPNTFDSALSANIISSHTAFTILGFVVVYNKNFFVKSLIVILAVLVIVVRHVFAQDSIAAISLSFIPVAISFIYLRSVRYKNVIGGQSFYKNRNSKINVSNNSYIGV